MCLSTDKWIKRMRDIFMYIYIYIYIYLMEFYSVMRKKKILPFATTWMYLEGIMLDEIRQRKTNTV